MFALSARFRKSRKEGADGSIYYIIRNGKEERNLTSLIKGPDESIITEAKNRIAFDLMTIYCVIESLFKKKRKVTLDEVTAAAEKALTGRNPYAARLQECQGRYVVYDDIAKIAKIFSDRFERRKRALPMTVRERSGLLGYLSSLIQEYTVDGKPYAKSLRSAQRNLIVYLNGADLKLSEITPRFILDYKVYLSGRVSTDTVTFYIRVLRTVINRAERDGLLPANFRWPSEAKTIMARSVRKADVCTLDIETIRQIERLDLSADRELGLVRDIFMFGFYAQGMELIDIANLKTENLSGNVLSYRRRQKGRQRDIKLGNKALAIVDRYHDSSHEYLFPLLQRQWIYSYATVKAQFSTSLRKIGAMLASPINLTFSMNIYSWHSMVQSVNIAETLVS